MLVLALVVFAAADMMMVVVVASVEVVRAHFIGSHELFRRKCWVVATAVAVSLLPPLPHPQLLPLLLLLHHRIRSHAHDDFRTHVCLYRSVCQSCRNLRKPNSSASRAAVSRHLLLRAANFWSCLAKPGGGPLSKKSDAGARTNNMSSNRVALESMT